MRKIYDCFTFFNEYDLLDIRLEEHYDHVDHFVIVESNKSFQNKDKEFNLEKNWDRYSKYHDKIIYIKVEDMPGGENPWVREAFQRNAIERGIVDAAANDYYEIMWSSSSTNTKIEYDAAQTINGNLHPEIPSIIVTVNQVG